MANILVFYWEPGSCGDFVNKLLLERPLEYQGVHENLVLTDQGRVVPKLKKFFADNFNNNIKQWYQRNWSVADCALLLDFVKQLECKWFVVPTHRVDQVDFLKSQFENSYSMGITYPDNMFPLVLKNWCKKVAASDVAIQEIYNNPVHQYLKNKNKFGEFVLSEQLKYGTKIKLKVENIFDIELCLEDIYNSELSDLKSLFHDSTHVDQFFNDWMQYQSKIHSYHYDISDMLCKSLGHNSRSKYQGDLSVNLDTFDNILIRHHCIKKNIPSFDTLQQASDFFNRYSSGT
jgi:hypothetical protein